MRLRINALLVGASVMMTTSIGCGEPQEMVPVAPPGFDIVRVPSTPQGEGAQALGETGSATVQAKKKQAPRITADSPPTPIGQPTTTAMGLTYETLREGTGPIAKSGDQVLMHYTGTLVDGTKFDSSLDKGSPLPVTLGMEGVIRGWDEGIPGMKVGEKRKLTIPPDLAYRDQSKGTIPPNSTLIFEVELMSIK